MGYTNKTTKFQLPQFVKTDKPQMADFNDAFKNIDDKAVSKSGDTMTGDLTVEKNTPRIVLKNADSDYSLRIHTTGNTPAFVNYKDADNYNGVYLNPLTSELKNRIKLMTKENGGTIKYHSLYGEHNKPTVTYTGNGSTALRNIVIGGTGSVVAISSSRGCAIVNPINGLCYSSSGGVEVLNSTKIKLQEGNLILATDNEKVNANGVTYTCTLL